MVTLKIKDRIGYITLSRVTKRNALNDIMISQLTTVFEEAEQHKEVKVIVLRSEGDVFCAGADMEYMQKLQQYSYQENLADSTLLKDLFILIYKLKKIVIAEVQGPAIAGGFGLATVCDFIIASKQAKFGYPEVKIGFVPAIVSVFLIRKVGEAIAKNLLLSGMTISAKKAKKIGLVYEVAKDLEEEVHDFALQLCNNNSSYSMAATKQLIDEAQNYPLEEALNYAAELNARARKSEAAQKGFDAFLNKKKLNW